jgi:myxalamid-type polyketide synthase MxaD
VTEPNFATLLASISPEKRALLAEMLRPAPEPVAIVGMACRFPGGAGDPERFWELLVDGRDAVTEVPAERWPVDAYYDADPAAPGKINSRYGAFLEQVDQFDPAFFGISPREAARMDPQQRLFLEVVWEALEDAGQTQPGLAGSKTGVFAGVYQADYSSFQLDDPAKVDAYVASGVSHAIVANRVSFLFDLRGPSLAVDTACSSSLVAFHVACQSLRRKECDMALAGGVNLILSPLFTLPVAKWGMLSPDGRCKSFDASADGMVRGEGCGVVVLKRLSDAQRDNDRILAVCRGTATNQDGRTNALTAPNGLAQQQVIEQALRDAGLEPAEIGYVEAHGTGTALGDPIEMEALVESLGRGRPADRLCLVGSVKTQIGHLEAAAGIAGLIKTVLALQHRTIPANLHFETLNPHINLDGVPFAVAVARQEWTVANGQPRRAGVSSFGFGGANAHAILEEWPTTPANAHPSPITASQTGKPTDSQQPQAATRTLAHLFTLSTPQAAALPALAAAYRRRLAQWLAEGTDLADICRSAARRRTHFNHRLAAVCRTKEELATLLDAHLAGEEHPLLATGRRLAGQAEGAVFIYSGQGAQWAGMGLQLYRQEPVFRRALDECAAYLQPHLPQPLLTLLESEDELHQTVHAQPALFAVQVALTALWQSWGIRPAAVAGHSLGEVTAAYVAGALSLADAARVVVERSRLMQTLTGRGKMAAAKLAPTEARHWLARYPQLALAAVNAPASVVVSGDSEQMAELLTAWQREGVHSRLLPVDYAFHSPQMAPLAAQLPPLLAGLLPQPTKLPLVSTVSGRFVDGESLDGRYWARNMAEPVLFAPAVKCLLDSGHTTFLEVSSQPVLSGDLRHCLAAAGSAGSVAASLRRDHDETLSLLANLATLYTAGHMPDWNAFYGENGRFIPLPTYPWQRKRYWLDHAGHRPATASAGARPWLHPLLERTVSSPVFEGRLFETVFTPETPAFLADHRIHDALVVPATAYLEMVSAAAGILFGPGSHRLHDMIVRTALIVPEPGEAHIQLAFTNLDGAGPARFQIFAATNPAGEWRLYAEGSVVADSTAAPEPDALDLDAIRGRCFTEQDGEAYYRQGEALGARFGPRFQVIERFWRRDGEVLARLQAPPTLAAELEGYRLHPAFADAAFHVVYGALPAATAGDGLVLPLAFEEVCYYRPGGKAAWCHFELRPAPGNGTLAGDMRLFDDGGHLLAEARGIRYRPAGRLQPERHTSDEWLYQVAWQPAPNAPAMTASATEGRGCLILAGQESLGTALAGRLREAGAAVVLAHATPGAAFEQEDDAVFRFDPMVPEHYAHLLSAKGVQRLPGGYQAVYLASEEPGEEALQAALYLGQAAVKQRVARPSRLWFVTRCAQAAGGLAVDPYAALLWGFGRSLALEHPSLWGGLIDLDHRPAEAAADRVLAELLDGDGEDQIAWREQGRLVARLEPLALPSAAPAGDSSPPDDWAGDATYLITGGLGAIGRELARWLAARGARHLALLGRSGATDEAEPFLAELRQAGAVVTVHTADVADATQLAAVWPDITDGRPPLKGVFHAAGVLADGTLAATSWSHFTGALAPKVAGAWNLHQRTRDLPLDFFVLFSSGASVLGSPGQSNYAAANAFLDALAHYRQQRALPGLSINWGPWQVGMAAGVGAAGERRWQAAGMGTLAPAEALDCLARLLPSGATQVAVLPLQAPLAGGWRERPFLQKVAGTAAAPHSLEPAAPVNGHGAESLRDQLLQAPARHRKQMLADYLRHQLGQIMGWDADYEIDLNQGLFDVGLDSLMAMELKEKLESKLALPRPLPFTLVFDYPNLASLIDYLHDEIVGPEQAGNAVTEDDLEQLSEDELVELLQQELGETE